MSIQSTAAAESTIYSMPGPLQIDPQASYASRMRFKGKLNGKPVTIIVLTNRQYEMLPLSRRNGFTPDELETGWLRVIQG